MKILFLDDDNVRHVQFKSVIQKDKHEIDYVYTSTACISKLKNNNYDIIFLDHDLGGQIYVEETKGSGYEVALYIENKLDKKSLPKNVIIHSFNPAGAERMFVSIKKVISNTIMIPFMHNNYINLVKTL